MKCISGTPDYPSDQNVTVVQWETKGCPGTTCEPLQPRSQCYRAAYNEKHAFASVKLNDEFAVKPATSLPYGHILNTLTSGTTDPATIGWPAPLLPGQVEWFSLPYKENIAFDSSSIEQVASGVAFYAYGYPDASNSNSGYEERGSMVTFMVQDTSCQSYILVLIDGENSPGGCVDLDLKTSGVIPADPIAFRNDPQSVAGSLDSSSFSPTTGMGSVSLTWSAGFNDGLVLGPLTMEDDWKMNIQVSNTCSDGRKPNLDTFKFGSYDLHKNEVGFSAANIKKATAKWGGLEFEAMECTTWCQRYADDCSACVKDDQCQYSAEHGGCVAADAYIYTFSCPRPMYAPFTKVMYRDSLAARDREDTYDGFQSTTLVRYSYDSRTDMSCPCSSRYRYEATVYEYPSMRIVYNAPSTPVRLDTEHTFVDFPGATLGAVYHIYSYLCVDQGTLSRDDCSPVKVDPLICNVQLADGEVGCVPTGEVHQVIEGSFEVN